MESHHQGILERNWSANDIPLSTVRDWLHKRRQTDGAEGLWRIHDKLYDLSNWLEHHPGGPYWLQVTKGTDVTEAFEANHIGEAAEKALARYYVRDAKSPRHYLITFDEKGFFKTLKRKIRARRLLGGASTKPQRKTKVLADTLAACVFLTALLGITSWKWFLVVSGMLLAMLSVCAHNFFHMRDNWRMYYFQLSLMSVREWRISHVLSHHLYPNTVFDLEVTMVEPFLMSFLPRPRKKFRFVSWLLGPFVLVVMSHAQFLRRVLGIFTSKKPRVHPEELLGLSLPLFLFLFGGHGFWATFAAWNAIVASGSFTFGFIGFTSAHHHPDIYHEGDFLGHNKDFGIFQLAAVRNRTEIDGNFFLTMITFGEHALHHLFPTVDHSNLPRLYAVFEETCREFNIKYKPMKSKIMVKGMFQQLVRNSINNKLTILGK